MADEQRVIVADRLWAHEAGMLKGVLESAGINAAVKGALSTSGEIPAPAASVSVLLVDEAEALEVLDGIGRDAEPFVCQSCNEFVPAGYTECPMCAEVVDVGSRSDETSKLRGVVPMVLLTLFILGYLYVRVI